VGSIDWKEIVQAVNLAKLFEYDADTYKSMAFDFLRTQSNRKKFDPSQMQKKKTPDVSEPSSAEKVELSGITEPVPFKKYSIPKLSAPQTPAVVIHKEVSKQTSETAVAAKPKVPARKSLTRPDVETSNSSLSRRKKRIQVDTETESSGNEELVVPSTTKRKMYTGRSRLMGRGIVPTKNLAGGIPKPPMVEISSSSEDLEPKKKLKLRVVRGKPMRDPLVLPESSTPTQGVTVKAATPGLSDGGQFGKFLKLLDTNVTDKEVVGPFDSNKDTVKVRESDKQKEVGSSKSTPKRRLSDNKQTEKEVISSATSKQKETTSAAGSSHGTLDPRDAERLRKMMLDQAAKAAEEPTSAANERSATTQNSTAASENPAEISGPAPEIIDGQEWYTCLIQVRSRVNFKAPNGETRQTKGWQGVSGM
jgi:hypothetical protein